MLSLVLIGFVAGGIVTWWGYYTPFIIFGTVLFTIGAGLLLTIQVDTTNWKVYGFTIVAGAGLGFSMQNAFMSVQAVLPQATLPIGNAIVMFSQTLAGAMFLAISNSVLSNGLVSEIAKRIPNIDPATIINAGATGIREIVNGDQELQLVLEAYNLAVRHVLTIAVICGALSFVASLGFEWRSIKGKNLAAGMA
jgi:hypothetical protein